MNPNVPATAAKLLDFIGEAETGKTGREAYDVLVFHQQAKLPKPLTEYTLDELLAAQKTWGSTGWTVKGKRLRGSAAGKYQIIRKTLAGLVAQLNLPGTTKFSPDVQDRLGFALLAARGWQAFTSGQVTPAAFALQLAKEWASMPVLSTVKGASREVTRGQSYYAGDGVNKSQVAADELEAILNKVRAPRASEAPVVPSAFPVKGARNNEVVAQVQRRLKELGYSEIGNTDGDFGDMTEKAIIIFKIDNQLPPSGTIDSSLLVAMAKAKPREISAKRAEATPETVRVNVPEARDSWWSKVVAFWGMLGTGVVTAINFIISNLEEARKTVKPLTDVLGTVPLWAWGLLFGGGLLTIWLKSRSSEKKSVDSYRDGSRR